MAAVPQGSFNCATQIPSLAGKVILITGANSGLGKQSALELSQHNPAHIWMAARSPEKGIAAVADVQKAVPSASVSFLKLDLGSFESIKAAASNFLKAADRFDMLFLNAGILGAPAGKTDDGVEIHMGTNHLGHALLLKLLTPLLIKTAETSDVRVMCLSSIGYKHSPTGIPFDRLKTLDESISPIHRYMHSKLANLLYAKAVAKRYPQFTTVAIDPGSVDTQLFKREPGDDMIRHLQTNVAPKSVRGVDEGVKNQMWAATAEGVKSGEYYEPIGVGEVVGGFGKDEGMADELWEWTQRELQG